MQFDLATIAHACDGRLEPPQAASVLVSGVSIDSRTLVPGSLFVPVVAERDGHDFIADALRAGAAAYLTARSPGSERPAAPDGSVVPAVVVADTAAALTALGTNARDRLPERIIGITGSVGKTSVKDLATAALAGTFVTTSARNSFNNELGVPLTLLNGPDGAEAAVVEMGARGIGHIRALCAVARPTVGIVTRVAPAHLELFGSIDAVAVAKGELIEALPAGPLGVAVLNHDDPLVSAMAGRGPASVLTFGLGEGADVRASEVRLDEQARASFELHSPWGRASVRLPVSGAHMVLNALAALAAALAVGVALPTAAEGVAAARLSPWRMEVTRTASGVTVLNDAYNASPVAVRAAFDALDALAARSLDPGHGAAGPGARVRRVAVLGPMAELGAAAAHAHQELAEEAAARGIEVFSVGTDLYRSGETIPVWADVEEAARGIDRLGLRAGDVVLIKASRVAGLERLAARMMASQPSGRPISERVGGGVQPGTGT